MTWHGLTIQNNFGCGLSHWMWHNRLTNGDLPGHRLHLLRGDLYERISITTSDNWRFAPKFR